MAMVGCAGPSPDRLEVEVREREVAEPMEMVPPGRDRSEPPIIQVQTQESDQWLNVTELRAATPGGWATGDFDSTRNKIDIRTRDVAGFTIDVGRIPINWERKVILGIDGRNTELRRRDYTLIRFRNTRDRGWTVIEP